MPNTKEQLEMAQQMLERRRESQRSKKRLSRDEYTHLMSVLPLILGVLSDLPLEQALNDLLRAETVGPILDPTLYKEYIYSGKGDELKDMLNAVIRVKALTLDQDREPFRRAELTEERDHRNRVGGGKDRTE